MTRTALIAAALALLVGCGSGVDAPLELRSSMGDGWGNAHPGLNVLGELRVENRGPSDVHILEVVPIVESGGMEVIRLGLLGQDRAWGNFDYRKGPIEETDFDGASVVAIGEVTIPPEPAEVDGIPGVIILTEFRLADDEHLDLRGVDVAYEAGGRRYTLELRGRLFLCGDGTSDDECASAYEESR